VDIGRALVESHPPNLWTLSPEVWVGAGHSVLF
jgi:hypothetical protein